MSSTQQQLAMKPMQAMQAMQTMPVMPPMPTMPAMLSMPPMPAMQAMQAMEDSNLLMNNFNSPTFGCVIEGDRVKGSEVCCPGLKLDTNTGICK